MGLKRKFIALIQLARTTDLHFKGYTACSSLPIVLIVFCTLLSPVPLPPILHLCYWAIKTTNCSLPCYKLHAFIMSSLSLSCTKCIPTSWALSLFYFFSFQLGFLEVMHAPRMRKIPRKFRNPLGRNFRRISAVKESKSAGSRTWIFSTAVFSFITSARNGLRKIRQKGGRKTRIK